MPVALAASADVAAWLRARTQDSEGREVGLFTEDTRPSVGQVEVALKQARTLVAGKAGITPPDPCAGLYETVVALQAACIIEKSYFPEQVVSGRSAYQQLAEELTAGMDALNSCIVSGGLGPVEGGSMDAYSVCTPAEHCAGGSLFAPANWNNPYADDVDDPYDPSRASAWLRAMQPAWAGLSVADLASGKGNVMTEISLLPRTVDLELYAGDGASFTLTLTDKAGTPTPVTGTVAAQIRASRDAATPLAVFAVDLTRGAEGIIVLVLSGEATAALTNTSDPFRGVWDCQWTPTGAQPLTIVQGAVAAYRDVTRD